MFLRFVEAKKVQSDTNRIREAIAMVEPSSPPQMVGLSSRVLTTAKSTASQKDLAATNVLRLLDLRQAGVPRVLVEDWRAGRGVGFFVGCGECEGELPFPMHACERKNLEQIDRLLPRPSTD